MVLNNQEKKTRQRKKQKKKQIVVKEFPVMPATWDQIQSLCERYGYKDWREMITVLLYNADKSLFELPTHKIELTEEQYQRCYLAGSRQSED